MELEKWFKDNKKGVKYMDYGQTISNVAMAGMTYKITKDVMKKKKCKGKVFGKAKRVKGVLDY